MTKAGLVNHLHDGHGALTKAEASRIVDIVLEAMKKTLGEGERILVTNFGSFEVMDRQERRGRNPATGDIISIRPRRTVAFRGAPRLEEALNPQLPTLEEKAS